MTLAKVSRRPSLSKNVLQGVRFFLKVLRNIRYPLKVFRVTLRKKRTPCHMFFDKDGRRETLANVIMYHITTIQNFAKFLYIFRENI